MNDSTRCAHARPSVSSRSHWIDTNLFGGGHDRVVFDVSGGPARARLRIYNVSEADDGIYRDEFCAGYNAREENVLPAVLTFTVQYLRASRTI